MERIWDGFKFGLGFSLAMGLLYFIALIVTLVAFWGLTGLPFP